MNNPAMRAFRLAHQAPVHLAMDALLTSTGQTLSTLASAAGLTLVEAEHRLSALVDEQLASRTVGDRLSCKYTAL